MIPAKACGRFWARLVLLSILVLHAVRPQSPWDFRRKHITLLENIDHNQCNSEMKNKRIALTPSGCKPINTFIHAPESQVDQACAVGKPYVIDNHEFKRSTQAFRVTNCRLSLSDVNECKYRAEPDRWRYIVVTCDQNGRPVHLARTLADDLVGKLDDQNIHNEARALNSPWLLRKGDFYVPCFWAGLLVFSITFPWWL